MRVFVIVVIMLLFANAKAQQGIKLAGNERVPDIEFKNMLNYKSKKGRLSDFYGKIVILDFWNRYCSSCIATFPKAEQLNDKYEDQIIIIPVTKNSTEDFKAVSSRSQILKEANLIFVLNDTSLHQIFSPKFVPYYVWISKEGRLIGMSSSVTMRDVERVLSGKKPKDSVTITPSVANIPKNFLTFKSSLKERQFQDERYYSLLIKTKKSDLLEFGRGYRLLSDSATGRTMGSTFRGSRVIDLIEAAYDLAKPEDIRFETERLKQIIPPKGKDEYKEWEASNLYNFTICYDPADARKHQSNFREYIKNDLQTELGIVGRFEGIKRPCYILKKIDEDSVTIKASSGGHEIIQEITNNGIYIKNGSMELFLAALSKGLNKNSPQDTPILDESGWKGEGMDIYLKCSNLEDISVLNEALKSYGLILTKGERLQKTLILKNVKQPMD